MYMGAALWAGFGAVRAHCPTFGSFGRRARAAMWGEREGGDTGRKQIWSEQEADLKRHSLQLSFSGAGEGSEEVVRQRSR